MKIIDAFKLKPTEGDVGIEIEVEGYNLQEVENQYWTSKGDDSLKAGLESFEYVLRYPLKTKELKEALINLNENLEDSKIVDTIYAGIHIHINIQELTLKQLINYVCVFIVLEELLVDWCGDTRVGNHFCLRTIDAQELIEFVRNVILDEDIKRVNTDDIRYGSFNLKSVPLYGSLEFRTLKSTLNIPRIMTWVGVLLKLKEYSKNFSSPDKIMVGLRPENYQNFVQEALGTYSSHFLTSGWEKKIKHGIYRAQDIAYVRDWDKINLNIFKSMGLF